MSLIAEVLAAWRDAEREAFALHPDSPNYLAAHDAAARLHDMYHDLARMNIPDERLIAKAHRTLEELRLVLV